MKSIIWWKIWGGFIATQEALEAKLLGKSILPPKPTHDELAARDDLYIMPGRAKKFANIIDYLNRIWRPWIDAGELTRPELLHIDPTAYRALAKWLMKPDNDLVAALGADIPKLQAVTDRLAEAYSARERPAHVEWALRSRTQRAREKAR